MRFSVRDGRLCFFSKMAADFLQEHDKLLNIFNDSAREDEFEGFDLEGQNENIIPPPLSIKNWIENHKPIALLYTALTTNLTKAMF